MGFPTSGFSSFTAEGAEFCAEGTEFYAEGARPAEDVRTGRGGTDKMKCSSYLIWKF